MKLNRHPSNRRLALREGAKKKDIPFNPWHHQVANGAMVRYMHYARRHRVSDMNYGDFAVKIKAAFPRIPENVINYLFYNEKEWENDTRTWAGNWINRRMGLKKSAK